VRTTNASRSSGRHDAIPKIAKKCLSTAVSVPLVKLDAVVQGNAFVASDARKTRDSDHTPLYFASTRTPKRAGVGKVLKRKKGKAVRTTRGAKQSKKGAKSFAGVLDEAMLDRVPPEVPTYASAAAAPPRAAAPRKFCSVCGFQSCYNCARCGMRFCSRKCNAVHTETRCLKFTA
jgi:zinc finger HIT domain-containing protein 1